MIAHTGPTAPAAISIAVGAITAAAGTYLVAAIDQRRRGRRWSAWRTTSFLAGLGLLAIGLFADQLPSAGGEFRQHMLQHLLIGMFAPLGLALGAPVTLVLRTVTRPAAATIGRILRAAPVRMAANAHLLLLANIGGLLVLYFTPLYRATLEHRSLHEVVHAHFFLAGYLFAWVVAGADPAPGRPSVPRRLVLLGVAIFGHAVVAQLIYAGVWVQVPATAGELRAGGDLMYFGGDIAELLLAFAVVTTWKTRRADAGSTGGQPIDRPAEVELVR
jgi:putative membrane protein